MASSIETRAFTDVASAEWDAFVQKVRAPFLFERAYMDYHRNRFPDASLLLYEGSRISALFPATVRGDTVFSHRGLTYGGLIHDRASTSKVIEMFNALGEHYERAGCSICEYKPVPYIYAAYPAQEDLYALFRLGGTLAARAISASIPIAARMQFSESRRSGLRKSARVGARVVESEDFPGFWNMLEATLAERHDARPVHTLAEMELLRSRFPTRIRLFLASMEDVLGAGCVIYDVNAVAHVQYIGSTADGRRAGLLDALFDHLINRVAVDEGKTWFDFGTSTEQGGEALNANLAFQKEGFGGRGVVYDTYRYSVAQRVR
jgi:hypothetical protein